MALVMVITTLGLVVVTGSPSQAAAGNHTVNYSKSWTFKSVPLARCVFITASGNITYTTSAYFNGGHAGFYTYKWTNQRLNAPKLAITVTAMGTKASCLSAKTITKATLAQHWTGYSCSYNPSLSVSVPFGVSVSAWPSCGNRTQGTYSSTYSTTSSSYTQYNSGSPVAFGEYDYNLSSSTPPCLGVFPSVTIYSGSSSDSFGAGDLSSGEVCLPY
jgi:hypothetical protein